MPARIRLSRWGKRSRPFYRLVIAERQKPRDGRYIEVVGTYDPLKVDQKLTVKKDRVDHWLKQGATPTDTVAELLKAMG